jgi:hypothetical protein
MSTTVELPKPTAEAAAPGRAPWLAGIAGVLLPSLLTLFLAFRDGGAHPDTYAATVAVLAIALVGAAIASRRPFAGLSRPLVVAGAALALLVAWTWISGGWSDAPARAVFESQRTALYLFALVLCGALPRTRRDVELAVTALAAAILVVCVAALATRLFPDVFSAARTANERRLSFPIGYWNSLGVFAGIGLVLLLHLASSLRAHPAIRITAAAGVPLAAATIYFTFSRGALGAIAVGLLAYVLVGRSRGTVGAALATAPAVALALGTAYAADLLGTWENTSAAAADQGHRVAAWLLASAALAAVLRYALAPLDRRLERTPPLGARTRRALLVGAAGVALLGAGAAIALDAPDRARQAYESFTKPESGSDARTRLRTVSLSGRQDLWDVALHYFRAHPLEGEGAGTFETQWLRSRPVPGEAVEGHSLYLETLSELGLVGFALLMTAIVSLLAGLLLRARGEWRGLYGALFAAMLLWAVHAGVDWDWELPALGVPLFAVAGVALARSEPRPGQRARVSSRWPVTVAVALACGILGVTAVRAVIADHAVREARVALVAGDCRKATADADTAVSALGSFPAAYEILGWCRIEARRNLAAVSAMREAVRLDPEFWRYRYALGIARAAAGADPRPDVRRARALNPSEQIFTKGVALNLARASEGWRRLVSP